MKKIIFTVLVTGLSLIAADNAKVTSTSGFVPINGGEIYQQHCATCHGVDGRSVPTGASYALAGRDAVKLALTIRSYRDQDKNIGAFTKKKHSEIMLQETAKWSDRQIGVVAKYISGLE